MVLSFYGFYDFKYVRKLKKKNFLKFKKSVYQLFFYENEEQREIRDYQEQQRYFRRQQELQQQRDNQERLRNRQQEEEVNEEDGDRENLNRSEGIVTPGVSRGFFGTIFFVVYLFFISMYPSYEFVPSSRRVEHEHQE